MKSLLIMRHAKSSWKKAYLADHDRSLNKRGKRDAPRMGRLLRNRDLVPDLIISSTATRAVKSATLVADACGYVGEIDFTRGFYGAGSNDFIDSLGNVSNDHQCVLIVAHNPGLEELVEDITGSFARMPTGAIAHVELDLEDWSLIEEPVEVLLADLWLPRELKD